MNLYRIYEHIKSNIESEDIFTQGWWNNLEDTRSRFTCTANDPDAIGHEARHAGDGSDASVEEMSGEQMSHNEAKSLIDRLIGHWLEHRVEIHKSSEE